MGSRSRLSRAGAEAAAAAGAAAAQRRCVRRRAAAAAADAHSCCAAAAVLPLPLPLMGRPAKLVRAASGGKAAAAARARAALQSGEGRGVHGCLARRPGRQKPPPTAPSAPPKGTHLLQAAGATESLAVACNMRVEQSINRARGARQAGGSQSARFSRVSRSY